MNSRKRVRLKSIRKAEYELTDIFESIDSRTAEKVVENNVVYVLRREGILGKKMSVVVPAGGLVEFYHEDKKTGDSGFVQADFEVFRGHQDIVAGGTAYGQVSAGELIDLTVEVYPK